MTDPWRLEVTRDIYMWIMIGFVCSVIAFQIFIIIARYIDFSRNLPAQRHRR